MVTGLFTCYHFISRADHEFVFDFILLFVISTLSTIIFVWIVYKDRKEYFKSKRLNAFIPTFIGSVFLFGLLTIILFLNQRDNSPSKLYCLTKVVDFNGVSIDFREDGTYKISSWSVLSADYFRGVYTIKDSIIILEESKIENTIVSNRLVIRQEVDISEKDIIPGKETIYQKSVYQIDKQGKVIDGSMDFIIK